MTKRSRIILFSIFICLSLLIGCTSTRSTDLSRTNLKRKIALKKHLDKLNRENEQLLQLLNSASLVNIETYQVLDSEFVTKENIPEFNRILRRYKAINLDTQVAIDSLVNTVNADTQKNQTIDKMLDGIVPKNSEQQVRKDRIRTLMYGTTEKSSEWVYDQFHVGISAQGIAGSVSSKYGSSEEEFDYQGVSGTTYFTYVGEYNTLVGFQYAVFRGEITPKDDDSESKSDEIEILMSTMSTLSLGYRISSIKAFNILPQVVFGMGKTKFREMTSRIFG